MDKYCEERKHGERLKLIIDIEKDYYEMLKYNMLKYNVEHGQDYKPFEIIANGIPYENKGDDGIDLVKYRDRLYQLAYGKGMVDAWRFNEHEPKCENCDYRKFTRQFINGVVDVMTKNGISSVEELNRRLKGEES